MTRCVLVFAPLVPLFAVVELAPCQSRFHLTVASSEALTFQRRNLTMLATTLESGGQSPSHLFGKPSEIQGQLHRNRPMVYVHAKAASIARISPTEPNVSQFKRHRRAPHPNDDMPTIPHPPKPQHRSERTNLSIKHSALREYDVRHVSS